MEAKNLLNKAEVQANAARTQFEAFIADEGVLRLTEHYTMQAPVTRYGKCEAKLIRSRDTRSDRAFVALRLDYTNSDEYKRETTSLLDQDELSSLASALKYIFEHQQEIAAACKTYTEVTYKSRGGFEAGFYVNVDRKIGEYMSIGGQTAFLTSLAGLAMLIDDSIEKIGTFVS